VVLQHVASGQGMAWAAVAMAGLGVLKQVLVGEVARRLDMPDPPGVRRVQLALGLAQPLVDLFHLSMILSAAWTRRITWGHIVYEIAGPHAIDVKERRPFTAA
jgi:hypothetical protein